ncbi:MAG: response regulator [Oscillospiraceae bacterium]|nr:response regulator [Oscillospiraceae bacterium]
MTVLVVDDLPIMRAIIKDILTRFGGFDSEGVFEAEDGGAAVKLYAERRPDIVFLDVYMPGMDGLEAVKAICAINPKAKIIMCTGRGEEDGVAHCLRAGAVECVNKPVSPEQILAAVEAAMGRPASG